MATALPLVNVTVRLVDQDGDPVIGAKVSAKLMTVERYKGYVIPEEYLGVTDDQGTCIVRLFPNELGTEGSEYRFKISYPKTSNGKSLPSCHIGGSSCYSQGGKSLTVYASIPNADCNLEDVCDLDPYPIRGSGQIFTEQVLSAAEAAKKAAQDVENIKPDIEAAKQAAITATTKASIAESAATVAGLKADESASKAYESSSWASRSKAWAESPSTPDPDEPDSKSAKSWSDEAKAHNEKMPVTATGSTTPRPISDRFADVLNVKDFGAKGDGITDDTAAWNAWQTSLEKGGIGYVPSGEYLVNGVIRYFASGCFGNGIDQIISTALDENESQIANHYGDTGPIVQIYRNYADWENFSPLIDLSFDANVTKNNDWHVNGSGPQGIQVRGTAKGSGNTMPIGIRAFMQNKLNGDGDAVAIWGRVVKESPEDGINDSDSCGVHCSAWNFSDTGAGLVMASEHWAKQGSTRENEPYLVKGAQIGLPDGALVCQHVNANSSVGMAHALLLLAGGSEGYGAWNGIQIGRVFDRAGEHGVDHTVGINCGSWLKDYGYPMYGIQFGYCPNHVRMIGSYSYNIKADMTVFRNQVEENNAIVVINKDTGSGFASLVFQHKGVAVSDIITEVGNIDTSYRVRQNSGHHVFYAQDSAGTLKRVCSIGTIAVSPGTDNEVSLGWSSNRWTNVFAATGAISTSDERMKQDISDIPDSVFSAWEKVNFQQFKFKDAVKKKGNEARLHSGLIAQRIIEAFKEEGLDASEYGLLCYDEWPAEEAVIERVKVVDHEETHNEDGSIREPEQFHYEENVLSPAREAGNCYSVRYEEALCLEAAYQRSRADRLEQRIVALEAAIKKS